MNIPTLVTLSAALISIAKPWMVAAETRKSVENVVDSVSIYTIPIFYRVMLAGEIRDVTSEMFVDAPESVKTELWNGLRDRLKKLWENDQLTIEERLPGEPSNQGIIDYLDQIFWKKFDTNHSVLNSGNSVTIYVNKQGGDYFFQRLVQKYREEKYPGLDVEKILCILDWIKDTPQNRNIFYGGVRYQLRKNMAQNEAFLIWHRECWSRARDIYQTIDGNSIQREQLDGLSTTLDEGFRRYYEEAIYITEPECAIWEIRID
jgi:hypothetical protein